MRKKLFFPILAVLLLTPWPVAYAYDNTMASPAPVQIEAAEPSAAPGWSVFGKAIGGVSTPGDLFYIDTTNSPADILFTLHLTNADELVRCYRYLILNVGVYIQTGEDQWEKTAMDNAMTPDIYITMQNGRVSFTLPGYAKYKITIDSGSFYSFSLGDDEGASSPKFYLTAE